MINELIEEYYDTVLGKAFNDVKDLDDAKDIAQNVFLLAFRFQEQFKGKSSPSSWLYRIAVNEINQYFRTKNRPINRLTDLHPTENLPEESYEMESPEAYKIIGKALRKKDEHIACALMQGYCINDIALMTKQTIPAIKSRVCRMRGDLKKPSKGVLKYLKTA